MKGKIITRTSYFVIYTSSELQAFMMQNSLLFLGKNVVKLNKQ